MLCIVYIQNEDAIKEESKEQNTSLKTELFIRRNKMCLIYIWQITGGTSRKKELAMK